MWIYYMKIKKQFTVIKLLQEIKRVPMSINWSEIIEFQIKCLKSGANGVGIPDLIIAQNARLNDCHVYSLDKHFGLLRQIVKIKLH